MDEYLILNIEGKEYKLKSISFDIGCNINYPSGEPSSTVTAGVIRIEVCLDKFESYFANWALNQERKNEIEIQYSIGESEPEKIISGKNIYLIRYSQNLDVMNKELTNYSIELSMEELTIGNTSHLNDWKN